MSNKTITIILLVAALVMLIASGVLLGMGLSISVPAETTQNADELVQSIGVEQQYKECNQHFSPLCYNWQYIKGNLQGTSLTVGNDTVSLAGTYNSASQLTEVKSDLNILYLKNISTDQQFPSYVAVTPTEFATTLNTDGCVQGAYFNFSRLLSTLNTGRFSANTGHSGILELQACTDAENIDPLLVPERFTQSLLDL